MLNPFLTFPEYLLNNSKILEEYDGLVIDGGDFWNNTRQANKWAIKKHLKKLRKPVDKEMWSMSVEETNGYYSPTENAMVFPAGKKIIEMKLKFQKHILKVFCSRLCIILNIPAVSITELLE